MVTVQNFVKRHRSDDGKEFNALILGGDMEFVQSAQTGNFYISCKTCSITSTLSDQQCQALIGKTLPGEIQRVEVPAYQFTIEETGEVITRTHRFRYNPNPNSPSMEETVFQNQMATAQV